MPEPGYYYRNGLAVLQAVREPPPFMEYDPRLQAHVAPGHRYPELRVWGEAHDVAEIRPGTGGGGGAAGGEDDAAALDEAFADAREPRDYQIEALERWWAQGGRGSVVLPTGSGKTLVALLAIRRIEGRRACVVAPTRALVSQWFNQLADAFGGERVGAWYGDEKEVRDLTVTTYHSAFALLERHGSRFDLLVLDEVHHLADRAGAERDEGTGRAEGAGRPAADVGAGHPGAADGGEHDGPVSDSSVARAAPTAKAWHDALRIAPAAHRLGLTATYPDGRDEQIAALVGPVAYRRRLGEMLDAELADLAVERRFVALTPDERARYDAAIERYEAFVDERRYRERLGESAGEWWPAFMAETRRSPEARRAFAAFRERERIVALASGKLALARRILGLHPAEQAILFCGSTEAADEVARRFAIPLVRAETPASERRRVLEMIASGEVRAVAAVEVLDEGWDVPEAKLGIVLGSSRSGGRRQHQQRLGRILRKQGDRVASLFEIVVADTHEFFTSQRRGGALRSATDRQLGLGL